MTINRSTGPVPYVPKQMSINDVKRKERTNQNIAIANDNAAKYKAEADKANSVWDLTKKTLNPINMFNANHAAITNIQNNPIAHPIQMAKTVLGPVYNEGIRPMINLPIRAVSKATLGSQMSLPRLNLDPQNEQQKAISEGFGFGAAAGSYLAPQKLMYKAMGSLPYVSKIPSIARPFISDQILTQAYADQGTSYGDRAIQAAVTPALSFATHGFGKVNSAVKEQLSKGVNKIRGIDTTEIKKSPITEEEIKNYYNRLHELDTPIMDPKTGIMDEAAMKARVNKLMEFEKRMNATHVSQNDKSWLGIAKNYITSGKTIMERNGSSGADLAGRLKNIHAVKAARKSALMSYLPKKYDKFIKDQGAFERVINAQEDPSNIAFLKNKDERDMLNAVRAIMKDVHEGFSRQNIQLTGPKGEKISWKDSTNPENHYPHYYDKKVEASLGHKESEIVQMMSQHNLSHTEAELAYNANIESRLKQGKVGVLERPRMGNDPNYRRDFGTLMDYINDASKLHSRAELLGQTNQKIMPLLEDMSNKGADIETLTKIIEDVVGNSEKAGPIISALLQYNQFTKLPLSFFSNLTQVANTIMVAGTRNTFSSLYRYVTSSKDRAFMKEMGENIGVFDDLNITKEADVIHGKVMDSALYIFKKVEEFNRTIAADAARGYLTDLTRMIKKDPMNGEAIRGLQSLGLNPEKVASESFKLTEAHFASAANTMVTDTQFIMNAMNLPLWSRRPTAKVFTQFKSFGYMQTTLLRDRMFNELKHGNVKPLMRFAVVMPIMYFSMKYARQAASGLNDTFREYAGLTPNKEKTEDEKNAELFSGLLSATGALPAQLFNDANYIRKNAFGEKGAQNSYLSNGATIFGNTLGPSVSDAGALIKAYEQAGNIKQQNRYERPENQLDPMYPVKRFSTRFIPYFGPGFKNIAFHDWPQRDRETFRNTMKEGATEYFRTHDEKIRFELLKAADTEEKQNVLKDVLSETKKEIEFNNLPKEDQDRYTSMKNRQEQAKYLPIIR